MKLHSGQLEYLVSFDQNHYFVWAFQMAFFESENNRRGHFELCTCVPCWNFLSFFCIFYGRSDPKLVIANIRGSDKFRANLPVQKNTGFIGKQLLLEYLCCSRCWFRDGSELDVFFLRGK